MKTIQRLLVALIFFIISMMSSSCEKEELHTPNTNTYQQPQTQEPYTPPTNPEEIPPIFLEQ